MKEREKSTKEKLRESEEKLKDFMEAATEGFLVYDSELNLRDINDSALRIIGMRRETVIGKHILEITPGLEKTGRYNAYLNVIKTGEPFYTDDAEQLPKFGNIHLSIHAFKLVVGLGMIFNDVTERVRAEQKLKESEEKWKALSENSPAHIMLLDRKHKILFINRTVPDLSKEEVIGVSAYTFIPQEFHQITRDSLNSVWETGEPDTYSTNYITKEGNVRFFDVWVGPVFQSGKIIALVSHSMDVTENQDAKQRLKKSEKKYRKAFNRAEFYKDLFTHDINNILQNILSGIQLSEMAIGSPEKLEKLKEYFSIIKNQLKRGSKLVSNIRTLSKLEETEISIKKVEICNILKKSITYMKNAYHDRNITVHVKSIGKELYVKADELLEDLFENILVNAIKHNERSIIEILVKISREEKKDRNYLKMEFIDRGIGIDDSRKKLVFQRGYSDEKSIHGMGLGLSLVQKIIDNYDGKIWIEDRVNGDYTKGSNFVILFPEVL